MWLHSAGGMVTETARPSSVSRCSDDETDVKSSVMSVLWLLGAAAVVSAAFIAMPAESQEEQRRSINSAEPWAAIAELPDWMDGIWLPNVAHQRQSYLANDVPWRPEVAKVIDQMLATKAAGDPYGLFLDCLPLGMPSWILGSHNAMEILFTPGRITMLGELDGNRLRRIHTDGRTLPEYPDPTYHGYSVGQWRDDTLVVQTIGILPEVYISPDGENIGVRNGGNMRIREHIYLSDPDTLRFDLEITAPQVLTRPWRTSRFYSRLRGPTAEIIEGVCLQGNWIDQVDEDGKTRFVPVRPDERQ